MCGIAGLLFADGRFVDRNLLARMAAVIQHRGPDGEGCYVDEAETSSVGLINRRLAVIDIPGGDQPMSAGNRTIVYNGEVFNAPELRTQLESAGHRFRS